METNLLLPPLLGGALIGLSCTILFLTLGRVAGISGIVAALSRPAALHANWRLGFVAGLVVAGWVTLSRTNSIAQSAQPPILLIAAGLLVGTGTRLGTGCTSGHGVCGLSRLSKRSAVATCVFMGAGVFVVAIARHALAGGTP